MKRLIVSDLRLICRKGDEPCMVTRDLLAEISRAFFRYKKVYSFRMHKVEDMSDDDVIRYCHWFCEGNGLTEEFVSLRAKSESEC